MQLVGLLIQAGDNVVRRIGPGPKYLETSKYLDEGMGRLIVEPWNTVSCLLFFAVVAFWLIRLRGQYRRHAFLTACLPLVAIGGVGGTVYHAFRTHRVWLFMDWIPIAVLCIAVSIYLWSRLLRRWWYGLLIVLAVFVFQTLNFRVFFRGRHGIAIMMTYSLMGFLIMLPAVGVLYRTRCRNGKYPLLALIFFVLAITARTTDDWWPHVFYMGTHWLWHIFGAAAGHMVAEYLYRLPRAMAGGGQEEMAG